MLTIWYILLHGIALGFLRVSHRRGSGHPCDLRVLACDAARHVSRSALLLVYFQAVFTGVAGSEETGERQQVSGIRAFLR